MQNIYSKIDREIKQNLIKLVNTKSWDGYTGKFVNAVEKKCNDIFVAKALTTNSGTSSLEIALQATGIKKGDEVIIPNFTFVATVQAVLKVGGVPVLSPIDLETYNISSEAVLKLISKRTKAVIFVHLFGNPSNIIEISRLCKRNKIFLIEDCAQAFGSSFNNKLAGLFGDFGAFSFNNHKQISCGEGGLLITKSNKLYKLARMIRHAGLVETRDNVYESKSIGNNFLMSEFQAAVLLPQLKNWKKLQNQRLKQINKLKKKLRKHPEICLQKVEQGAIHSYQRLVFTSQSLSFLKSFENKHTDFKKIYSLPLIKNKVIIDYAKFDNITKQNTLYFWKHHLGLTFCPQKDYSNFKW